MERHSPAAAAASGSQPSSPPDKDNVVKSAARSREGSVAVATRSGVGGGASSQQKVKEAVAIAAGKKGMGQSDDDEHSKPIKSNMLCYLYWLLVTLILGLISFTVWLSIQLARRHSVAMMAESKLTARRGVVVTEVTLRRARLVLGWVTCPGSTPGGGTLFRYVTSHPGRLSLLPSVGR